MLWKEATTLHVNKVMFFNTLLSFWTKGVLKVKMQILNRELTNTLQKYFICQYKTKTENENHRKLQENL